ncbi:MAG: hypothetical protein DRG30_08035 [Epsilonproteobacteria bacterium]|nr:MAG: hypothetical protein DRG30_08035 [Campylobacterota bacterium]
MLTFIIIAIGLDHAWKLTKKLKRKILIAILVLTTVSFALLQHIKYVTYYYTSHSIQNPLLFKYDAPEIFTYLKDYQDYTIYDNIFFVPIYAGIYWQLDPVDFQQNAIWADPDDWGFSNAQTWNNLHLTETSINNLLCLKHQNPDTPLRALIIDDPGKYNSVAVFLSHDFSGSLTLHAVYDIDLLYPFVLENYPNDLCRLN